MGSCQSRRTLALHAVAITAVLPLHALLHHNPGHPNAFLVGDAVSTTGSAARMLLCTDSPSAFASHAQSLCRRTLDGAQRRQDLCLCPGRQTWRGPDRACPEQLAGPPHWQRDCAADYPLGGAVERLLQRHHQSVAQRSQVRGRWGPAHFPIPVNLQMTSSSCIPRHP